MYFMSVSIDVSLCDSSEISERELRLAVRAPNIIAIKDEKAVSTVSRMSSSVMRYSSE